MQGFRHRIAPLALFPIKPRLTPTLPMNEPARRLASAFPALAQDLRQAMLALQSGVVRCCPDSNFVRLDV